MSRIGILMIGYAGIVATSGCAAEPPGADVEQTQEAEVAAAPEGVGTNSIGQFHLLRMSNTQMCLQPQGGSTADVLIELSPCVFSAPAQNWLFVSQPGGWELVNQQSGKCLYNNSNATANGSGPITHEGCDVSSTGLPASNALWKPTTLTGPTRLMSEVHRRDSGFCLDVPGGNAFPGATLQMWTCVGDQQQTWVVGVD